MNVQDAAYHVVHAYEGGADALAVRLGTSAAVLRNKVNPTNDRNVLSLEEAVEITDFANDDRILYAWAAHRGKVLVDQADADAHTGRSLFACILGLNRGQGDMAKTLQDALADGKITPNELDAIERIAIDLQTRISHLARSARAAVPQVPA